MKCDSMNIKEILPLYLEKALDASGVKRVEQHLETCLDCRAELALLRTMAADPVPDPGEEFWSRMPSQVYRQVREQESAKGRWPSVLQGLLMPRWAWTSAAVLLVAALAWFAVRPVTEAPTVASSPALTLEEEYLPEEPVDVASLNAGEAQTVGSWADREMKVLASEAEALMKNGKDAGIDEELAGLDRESLERLSRMLDRIKKGGQV